MGLAMRPSHLCVPASLSSSLHTCAHTHRENVFQFHQSGWHDPAQISDSTFTHLGIEPEEGIIVFLPVWSERFSFDKLPASVITGGANLKKNALVPHGLTFGTGKELGKKPS